MPAKRVEHMIKLARNDPEWIAGGDQILEPLPSATQLLPKVFPAIAGPAERGFRNQPSFEPWRYQ